MKKILVCALVLVMCITAFVACNPTEQPDLTGLNGAKDYIVAQYGDVATDTSADYQRPAKAPFNGTYYDVTWTVTVTSGPATGITVTDAVDGFVTIDVDEFTEEDVVYTLTATVSDGNGNSVTATFNHKVPKFNSLTVAEFLALEEGDDVYAIIGYVMASAANPGKTGSFVIADETGAIFSYKKFEINLGDKVVVWGNRSSNAGVPQINTTEVLVLEANSSEYAEATPTELNAADIDLAALSNDVMPTMSGKYYKINGVTLVTSGGYTNANYNDAQLLQLYTNDAIVAACADFYNCKVNVYGYVRGFSSGKYLTIQVTRIEWGEDYEFVPSTPETRVAYEKENLSLEPIASTGETTLPTTGSRYADTTIDWAIKGETTLATLAGNVLTVAALPAANTEITLTATIKNGDVTDTKDVVVVIKKQRGALENKVTGADLSTFDALKALVPAAGNSTTDKYLTIGYVEEIKSTKYGNMVISNADGKTLEIYGTYGHDGSKRFDALDVKPGVGDVVVLYGIMDNYNGTIQMKNAWIMQINDTVLGNVHSVCTEFTEATCTEAAKCVVCGKAQGEALGHVDENPADGTCDRCGTDLSVSYNEETLAIKASEGTLAEDSLSISWATTNFDYIAAKGSSSTAIRTSDNDHFRVYQGSNFTIKANGTQGVAKIVITVTESKYASVCVASLTSTGATASADGTTVTITVTEGTLAEITFTATGQFRINNIVVYYVEA